MEKEIKKILYKVLPFVLCLCIVSGAAAPAYAAPTTIDQWAQYDGSGWSYNSSAGTFSWNTNMANSSEFVMLSYLRDLYSSIKTYNNNLKSGWLFSSSGYSYPSGWSGSFYKVVLDVINSVNTSINNNFHSNLQSYSSYPLYSYKNFIDSGLNNSQSFSSNNFIINFFSGISALNTNISYIANQFYADNASGSYNARSLLNQALHKYVDSSTVDYTTILNNIKSNTDYLSSINTYTANLSVIKTDTANLSGIKTDTANLSGIKTDTANLPGIKTDTANLSGIKTDTANLSGIKADIESFNNDSNNIGWITSGVVNGVSLDKSLNYLSARTDSKDFYVVFTHNYRLGNLVKVTFPIYSGSRDIKNPVYEVGNISGTGTFYNINDAYVVAQSSSINQSCNELIIYFPFLYTWQNNSDYYIHIHEDSYMTYYHDSLSNSKVVAIDNSKEDFYKVSNFDFLYNITTLFKQAKEVFFDDNTIAAKKANQAQEDTVLSNFTGSGAASASVSDFGAVKDSMVDFKAGFTGGASSSDTFSFLNGDSNAWDWFTQDTANDLDRTQGSNNRLLRSSSSVAYDTPLLDSYYTSILSILGGE